MTIKNVIFIVVFLSAFGFLSWSLRNLFLYMKVAKKKDNRFDDVGRRIGNVLKIAFGQSKLLREPVAGTVHFLIFWGFILFLFAVIEAIIQGFYSSFNLSFLGPVYSVITVIQDVFGLLVIIAVVTALLRRYVFKIPRLQVDKGASLDAIVILSLILIVVVSMLLQNMAGIAKNNFVLHEYEVRPISAVLVNVFFDNPSIGANAAYEVYWWIHVLTIFGFMNFLPYSKHLHVFTSIPNTYFANLDPVRNTIKHLNLEDENAESFGASDIEHLSWKQILDGYSCTECGRCTQACPAHTVGKSLNPKEIIVDIRRRTKDKAPLIVDGVTESELFQKTLVHDYVSDKVLWQCTTCMACVQECPVMIEHLDSIIDMRRDLVLTESKFPSELNAVFKSLETNYSPWAFNPADRAKWAEGLGVKTMAEDSNCEYLFWVGCAGSYDERYKKVSQSFSKLMQIAGVEFRILGTQEKCNGDTARRLGNEYLAQMFMMENVETLNHYKVQKIVTACPHCFHSLKNEYKQFGGHFEVYHHTELIDEMIASKKILLNGNNNSDVTYHDSCYLGRYNEVYDAPRKSLSAVEGINLIEMSRNKDKGFCCGAGGGRLFLEDDEGGRINEERTKEALATNAETIASACPFCMTMMTDGVKHFNKTEEVKVKDIAEIILENLSAEVGN
ncbi:MAG: 4Fe-4S dicluster domain-containing protein [Ignavibacteriota bacterium]|nr:MAG: 4Fe-4S dicluster domain-containing protein [Chlorobiota bacterium]MBE7477886.1 4Fe-4S dicluster domain-containing protein [Ignavibacteriales bacterium]MBL1124416.1 4Fe-4S dicluster domain-containing protein [Ignavibacteriota bacterium]MCC7094317.1 4Fe-4S dicluster domain-containing protein [Ignavibacteriaceae bacterium]MCE7857331.1 4Fe-4S dicluster domain-containing protein [Ignavibacteria bacterium CHB3]MEB2296025.1 heterodisulfide reductase-related iron-sulfur binding cluster [Ignavi